MTKILSQDDFQKQIVSQYTDVIGENSVEKCYLSQISGLLMLRI